MDTPSGIIVAVIFVILIDDVFGAIMFAASERDLNNDCLSRTSSEAAYKYFQGDIIHAPEWK